jgi:nitrous oxidase accessory protein NosD
MIMIAMQYAGSMTISAAEVQKQIEAAPEGGVVELPAARIEGTLVVSRPLTLRGAGAGKTIVDAKGRGPAIAVDARGGAVKIEAVTLTGGNDARGGGLSIDNGAVVELTDAHVTGNRAERGRGGGIAVDRGRVRLVRCQVLDNRALDGGGVYIGGDAEGELVDSVISGNAATANGGGLVLLERARVNVVRTRFEKNTSAERGRQIYLSGVRGGAPALVLEEAVFGSPGSEGPSISNDPAFAGSIELRRTTWPKDSGRAPARKILN